MYGIRLCLVGMLALGIAGCATTGGAATDPRGDRAISIFFARVDIF